MSSDAVQCDYNTFQVLDTQDLNIKRVTHSKTGKELEYDASTVDPIFGTKLEIQLPSSMETNSAQK